MFFLFILHSLIEGLCFWVPESKHRQDESILDDSTEDAEDTGDDVLVNSIQPGWCCRRSICPEIVQLYTRGKRKVKIPKMNAYLMITLLFFNRHCTERYKYKSYRRYNRKRRKRNVKNSVFNVLKRTFSTCLFLDFFLF